MDNRKRHTPKIPFIIGLILLFTIVFCFLLFETDAIYDIDISGFDTVSNELKRPISVEEVMRQVEQLTGGDEDTQQPAPGGTEPTPPSPTPTPPSPVNPTPPNPPPTPPGPTPGTAEDDIAKGLYTREDLDYLVALAGEASTYDGFYAVACCVRNRCQQQGKTVKQVVTAPGQFTGYRSSDIGNYSNKDVCNAAMEVLRGGPSTIKDYMFFLGRANGYDIWYEANKCGSNVPVVVGTGAYRNVYFKKWGDCHNKVKNKTSDAVTLYKDGVGWIY